MRRPRKGGRRIDAAIDHFAAMGYAAHDVRPVVGALVKLYGGPCSDVWRALEAGNYEVVRNRLSEIEEEKRQKQDQQLLLESNQQQDGQQVEDEPPQHQEPAADKEVEDPMFIEPPSREAALPLNAATRTGPRQESEDEEEEQPTAGKKDEVHVPSPGERSQ